MAKPVVYRAKCSFSVDGTNGPAKAAPSTPHSDAKSAPTSPNLLRSANINAINLNNKVNQSIQFFTNLSANIDDGAIPAATPGSPKVTSGRKDKSPSRLLADKENDKQAKGKGEEEDGEQRQGGEGTGKEKVDDDEKPHHQERVKVLLELPNKDQQTSKSSEDLTEVADDINEKDIKDLRDFREIFLGFKEGDLFRVLSKEWELWWAVRSLDANRRVGLVQAQFLESADDVVPDDEDPENMDPVESNVKASLDELRKRIGENDPAGIYPGAMIPEPELMERCNQRNQPVGLGGLMGRAMPASGQPLVNSEGLIMPRKPQNPCQDSIEKQKLHRELLFNTKMGKSVLNQKTELQRAMQKHQEHKVKKEVELQRQMNKTAFERVIEERARKLESKEKAEEKGSSGAEPEFMKVRAKLQAKMETK